jgi:hypothetical protein
VRTRPDFLLVVEPLWEFFLNSLGFPGYFYLGNDRIGGIGALQGPPWRTIPDCAKLIDQVIIPSTAAHIC